MQDKEEMMRDECEMQSERQAAFYSSFIIPPSALLFILSILSIPV
jgi:hypothetical protein